MTVTESKKYVLTRAQLLIGAFTFVLLLLSQLADVASVILGDRESVHIRVERLETAVRQHEERLCAYEDKIESVEQSGYNTVERLHELSFNLRAFMEDNGYKYKEFIKP